MIAFSEDLYNDFIMQLGGKRFGHGLFNSFSKDNVKKWTENTYGNILMFEIGTNDVLEIPCVFDKFLNEEISLYADACLAKSFC